jgi:hypothetical protein
MVAAGEYNLPSGTVKYACSGPGPLAVKIETSYTKIKGERAMSIEQADLTKRIYDFLEGTICRGKNAFERNLSRTLVTAELKKQKNF